MVIIDCTDVAHRKMSKNGCQRTGHRLFMGFLKPVLQLRLSMGDVVMNLNVQRPIARGKGPGDES